MKFKKLLPAIFFLTFALLASKALAEKALVSEIIFDAKENIEIAISKKTQFRAYNLNNPERLVLDIENAAAAEKLAMPTLPSFVASIRKSNVQENLRIVFDLKNEVIIRSSRFHKLKKDNLPRILLQITPDFAVKIPSSDSNISSESQAPHALATVSVVPIKYVITEKPSAEKQKNVTIKTPVIVIDAGHGGKDPGTIGDYARTKEKNITLSYAKELAKRLTSSKNYKVYLTRDSDEFLPLKRRVEKARHLNADLFISLHANAAADRNAAGFSIYTLSEKSSDRQAELLAQKENRADIIAGINFGDTSGDILTTLIDMSQRSSMNSSSQFANIAINSVQKVGVDILHNTHRFAGFAVLTAPDMTSILIELGYLSNRAEEAALNSLGHKRNIIKGLVDAIDEYFKVSNTHL